MKRLVLIGFLIATAPSQALAWGCDIFDTDCQRLERLEEKERREEQQERSDAARRRQDQLEEDINNIGKNRGEQKHNPACILDPKGC